jgi:hypothetical protein
VLIPAIAILGVWLRQRSRGDQEQQLHPGGRRPRNRK